MHIYNHIERLIQNEQEHHLCFFGNGQQFMGSKGNCKRIRGLRDSYYGYQRNDLIAKCLRQHRFCLPHICWRRSKTCKGVYFNLDLQNNKETYFFAVATCGRVARAQNVITQLRHFLKHKGIKLNYGERLDMFSNYVVGYEMRDTVNEEAMQSAVEIKPMIESIKNHITNKGNTIQTLRRFEHLGFLYIVSKMDKNFNISDACVSCDTCKKVCPVNNVSMDADGKPCFMHHCEQCLACIQTCPTKAINYKDKTQSRKRYIHPDIFWKDLAVLNGDCE